MNSSLPLRLAAAVYCAQNFLSAFVRLSYPPSVLAASEAAAWAFCGIGLLLGILTRWSALGAVVMTLALALFHQKGSAAYLMLGICASLALETGSTFRKSKNT